MIGVVAEFEREMINERATEGRKAAMAKGVKLGRKKALEGNDVDTIRLMASKGTAKNEITQKFGVSCSTVYGALENQKQYMGENI